MGRNVVWGPQQFVTADIKSAADELRHVQARIDVLRVACKECKLDFYVSLFQSIADHKLAVGQMILRVYEEDVDLLRNIMSWKNKLDYMVTRKDVQRSCNGGCADISLIHMTEAKDMYKRLYCKNPPGTLGNMVY